MYKYMIFLLASIICAAQAHAAAITCSRGKAPIAITLPYHDHGDRTIVGGKIYSKIFTYNSINAGSVTLACNKGPWSVVYYAIPVNGQEPIRHSDGGIDYLIFPTSLSGIGMSFNDTLSGRDPNPTPSLNAISPDIRRTYPGATSTTEWSTPMVTLWRIPGSLGEVNSNGVLAFTGPSYVQAIMVYPPDTISPDSRAGTGPAPLPNSWTANYISFTGGLNLYPATCTFTNVSVYLGHYNHGAIPDPASSWVDASFTLRCPPAWGSGVIAKVGNNGIGIRSTPIKNSGLNIKVVPRTEIKDSSKGIIALDGTGAKGYGVQLAWGDASTQPRGAGVPAKPVVFNTTLAAETISSYESRSYDLGENVTQHIKMAARFFRLNNEEVELGPASAVVEIIANYD